MHSHSRHDISLGDGRTLTLGSRALVMGIINVTPDSFSDGGDFSAVPNALAHIRQMLTEGAEIIDIGGESTRPDAQGVSTQDELDRVIPLLDSIAEAGIATPISIDTYKPLVADRALRSGAMIVNDVYGLQRDPEMAAVAARHKAPIITMHWDKARDTSKPVLDEILRYFERTLAIADRAGIPRSRIIFDPGFGFSKTLAENYAILANLDRLHALGCPILVGTSRKSMIGKVLGNEPKERLAGTIATNVLAYMGGAHLFRVHDVKAHRDALRIAEATLYGPQGTE